VKGNMLIISGPSGSGKSSLMQELLNRCENIYFSISTTTREIRSGEVDGINYHYISKEEFKQDIQDGAFLEWAKVHDNYYGTSLKPILKALQHQISKSLKRDLKTEVQIQKRLSIKESPMQFLR
jgi:guanylate kinase